MSTDSVHPEVREIVELFQRTMWLPDPGIIYITLATVAANGLPGDPIWVLLVGPPSSGKTETISALYNLSDVHPVSSFTEAGLLSGSISRDESGAVTGGLLVELGASGLILAPDFGTVLTEHASTRNRLFACLREVFDGRFTRRLGTQGGRTFEWRGHAGLLGACTEAIDTPTIDLGLLGERFSYYRIPKSTPDDDVLSLQVASDNAGRQPEIREERAAAVARFFDSLVLPDGLPPLTDAEHDRLAMLATLGARLRSAVVREGYSRNIETVPGHERPPRLFGQLRQLHAGLGVIGTPQVEVWRLLAKVALDGIHPGRRAVVDHLLARTEPQTTTTIAARCRLPKTTVRRHLEDLTAHGVIDFCGDEPERWAASDWLCQSWWAVEGFAPDDPAVHDGEMRDQDGPCVVCGAPPPRPSTFGQIGGCAHRAPLAVS